MARFSHTFLTVLLASQCRNGESFANDITALRSNRQYDAYRTGATFSPLTNSYSIRLSNRSFLSASMKLPISWTNLLATLPEQYERTASTQIVPTTMFGAIASFFASKDIHGPRLVLVLLVGFLMQRLQIGWTSAVTPWDDIGVAMCALVFWWFQEHVMHKYLLHSEYDWMGKRIHQEHHEKPYHHVSIDPAPLMIAWFTIVHVLLRLALPLHLALTATMAYGIAGLFYEWTHFIVHTRVRFSHGSYWEHVKNHHARHHLVNNSYWFAFSLTAIDDIFGTNPSVSAVPKNTLRQSLVEAKE
jgi:Fatty acid hydroxylase superfamily